MLLFQLENGSLSFGSLFKKKKIELIHLQMDLLD
jgi:hypothetical protein